MSALQTLESRLVGIILGRGNGTEGFGGPVKADARTGLKVYVEAYTLRLLEALRNDYEGLLRLAGPEEFERIGRAYIAAYPSHDPNLRWFGIGLAGFLRRHPDWRDRPALADLAAFEWAEGEAFDAADMPAMDAAALSAVAPEDWSDLGFQFHPSFRRVELRTDIESWLAALVNPAEGSGPGEPAAASSTFIFWRHDLVVNRRVAAPDEAAALAAAFEGRGFESVCRKLARFVGTVAAPARAAGLLRVWLDAGMIVGLRRS